MYKLIKPNTFLGSCQCFSRNQSLGFRSESIGATKAKLWAIGSCTSTKTIGVEQTKAAYCIGCTKRSTHEIGCRGTKHCAANYQLCLGQKTGVSGGGKGQQLVLISQLVPSFALDLIIFPLFQLSTSEDSLGAVCQNGRLFVN